MRNDGRSGGRGIWRALFVSAFVMIAIPFAARVVMERQFGADATSAQSAVEKFKAIFGDARPPEKRMQECVSKPWRDWTSEEVAACPALYAWLQSHGKTILPWEWSNAAKAKDPAGYRNCWLTIFDELARIGAAEGGELEKLLKNASADRREERALIERMSERLSGLHADLATNGLPATVVSESVRRGWLWGYNRKISKNVVTTAEDLRTAISGQEKALSDRKDRLLELECAIVAGSNRFETVSAVRESLSKAMSEVGGRDPVDADRQLSVLLDGIDAFQPKNGK